MEKYFIIIISMNLLLSGCFMEAREPLSPVALASYPEDIIDTWVMLHNKDGIFMIEKKDMHQLKITFTGKAPAQNNTMVSYGHISQLSGEMFFNYKADGKERYEFYKFIRPCPDLILLYLPNPEQIDKDIKTGHVKGEIQQDFFTHRILKENQQGLIHYIKSYHGNLFVPFRYLVRKSKADKLPKACKLRKFPGVPVDEKKQS